MAVLPGLSSHRHLGGGSGPISWTHAIAGRFDRHRGVALAIALSGTGLVAIVAPPYVMWLTREFGWRAGFLGIAELPLALLYFRPADGVTRAEASRDVRTPLGLTTRQALASYRF